MQKITPFLWFDGKADEAAKFYTSVFKNSKIEGVSLNDDNDEKSQRVMQAMLQMDKIDIAALKQAYHAAGESEQSPNPK